jgi:hypothetical protein
MRADTGRVARHTRRAEKRRDSFNSRERLDMSASFFKPF